MSRTGPPSRQAQVVAVISSGMLKPRTALPDEIPAAQTGGYTRRSEMKKFAYSRPVLAALALVALAVELGAGHKWG
jgi:hypothetical protein